MLKPRPAIDITVLIPVGGRHADVAALWAEYEQGLSPLGLSYECVIILDGPQPDVAPALDHSHAGSEVPFRRRPLRTPTASPLTNSQIASAPVHVWKFHPEIRPLCKVQPLCWRKGLSGRPRSKALWHLRCQQCRGACNISRCAVSKTLMPATFMPAG